MSMNIFVSPNTPRSFVRSAVAVVASLAAAGLIGLGITPPASAEEPILVPAPAPLPSPVAGAVGAVPGAGNQMGNAFLQMLKSMLGRVVPGADSIIPSTLPDQAAALPGPAAPPVPGQLAPAPAAPAPAHVGETVA